MLTAQARTGTRILVVEDEEDLRTFVATVLQDTGFVVECAADGHEALSEDRRLPSDFVLLDLMMPGFDGWGVLDQLRLKPDPPPVVVLSALADKRPIPQDGVAASLHSKPFVVPDLIRTCEKVSAI